jgi:hypothetical protein
MKTTEHLIWISGASTGSPTEYLPENESEALQQPQPARETL